MSTSALTAEPFLPGEASGSDLLEDAEHWAAVYEELTRFLLTVHAAGPDRIGHFRSRLEYWRHRSAELAITDRTASEAAVSR